MRKILYLVSLALLFNSSTSYSRDDETPKFSSMFSAKMYARFKNQADGYGENKNTELAKSEEMYIIDGVKVIVTNNYVKEKEAQLDRKARRNANDPRRMNYMEECISLTQNLDTCKELWEEANR